MDDLDVSGQDQLVRHGQQQQGQQSQQQCQQQGF